MTMAIYKTVTNLNIMKENILSVKEKAISFDHPKVTNLRQLSKGELLRLKPNEINDELTTKALKLYLESNYYIQQSFGHFGLPVKSFINNILSYVENAGAPNRKSISNLIKGCNQNHPSCSIKEDHIARHISSTLSHKTPAEISMIQKLHTEKINLEIVRILKLINVSFNDDCSDVSEELQKGISSIFSSFQFGSNTRKKLICEAKSLTSKLKAYMNLGNKVIRKEVGRKHANIAVDVILAPNTCGLTGDVIEKVLEATYEIRSEIEDELNMSFEQCITKIQTLEKHIKNYSISSSVISLAISRQIKNSISNSTLALNKHEEVIQDCHELILSSLHNYNFGIKLSTFAQRYIKNTVFNAGQDRGLVSQPETILRHVKTILQSNSKLSRTGEHFTSVDIANLANKIKPPKQKATTITPSMVETFFSNNTVSISTYNEDPDCPPEGELSISNEMNVSESVILDSEGLALQSDLREKCKIHLTNVLDKETADMFFAKYGLGDEDPQTFSVLMERFNKNNDYIRRRLARATKEISKFVDLEK